MSITPISPVVPPAPAGRAPGITKRRAVLIEVVSIVASVGAGHLVAGILAPLSSPFQAVADTMVRISPHWLVEIGKSLDFPAIGLPRGVADKVLLLVGIGAALVAVGALAGLAAYRSRRLGRAVIIVLGLVGLAAVVFSPVFAPVNLLAPLAAMLVGLSAYFRLYNLVELRPAGADLAGADPVELTRRKLLVSSAGVGAAAVAAGATGQLLGAGSGPDIGARDAARPRLRAARPAPPIPAGADFTAAGSPSFITANKDFYRIDTALRVPVLNPRDYRLRLHGMVDREISLSYDDLLRRPLEERVVTLCCVSNTVNGDLISNATFTGLSLRELLLEAGVRPGADQIFATSSDGWTCGTPTDVVLEPDRGALLALAMNGEPLPIEHGYPVRMVVPGLYGFVSATKWLTDLELTTFDRRRAYWLDRGWAREAPVKTASRIDRPRGLDTVPAGRFTAAGIAWAQHRGISRVEVRVDGGPWRDATLSTEVNRDTWRMWRAELTLSPGNHNLECRATDGAGAVQPEERVDPIPDGATGWPTILFTAR